MPVKKYYLVILLIFLNLFFSTGVQAEGKTKTIRVGYPIQTGMTDVDDQGNHMGYSYEYLQQIAQYTGWDFEFVEVDGDSDEQITEMMEMLKNGDIDLLSGMQYIGELAEIYDYSGQSYGAVSTVLRTLYEDSEVSSIYYQSDQKLNIGLIQGAKVRKSELDAFCTMNKVEYEPVYYESDSLLQNGLKNGEIDAAVGLSVLPVEGTKIIAKFASRPFYFLTTKGNQDIVSGINSAIIHIEQADPYFSTKLNEKYFAPVDTNLYLSEQEKEYLKEKQEIKVGIFLDNPPFEYKEEDSDKIKGISIDLLNYISEKTGLRVQLVAANTPQELAQLSTGQKVDMIAGVMYDYESAKTKNIALSKYFLSAPNIVIINNKTDSNNLDKKKLALPSWEKSEVEESLISRYNTIKECIEAVNSNQADYTYGNAYTMQYYMGNPQYKNITSISNSDVQQSVCFGIVKPVDGTLLSIINKAVGSISSQKLQSIIYGNTLYTRSFTMLTFLETNPVIAVAAVGVFFLCIVIIMGIFLLGRVKLNREISLQFKKYNQVYELSNERFFEYDYRTSELLVSTKQKDGENQVVRYDFMMKGEGNARYPDSEERQRFLDVIKTDLDGVKEGYFLDPDGEYHWMRIVTRTTYDEGKNPIYIIGKMAEIDEEIKEKERLKAQAQRDSLTGLFNAATCREYLNNLLGHYNEKDRGGMLILDIDYFKQINDQFGHLAGDKVLMQVAWVMNSIFRKDDVLGRIGGDEFMIYMRDVQDIETFKDKCDSLCEEIRQIRMPNQKTLRITCSVGGALTLAGWKYEELFSKADKALYTAKHNGRDRFEIFNEK